VNRAALLRTILHTLDELDAVVTGERRQFDLEPQRQWSATLLLISIGNAAKRFELAATGDVGSFTGIIRLRDKLAHQTIEEIDMSIVWRTAQINGRELRARALRLIDA
jgi:uncharacterized protein with HEPN domain